jgi:hypothetical protein
MAELMKIKREIRGYGWQRLWNRTRIGMLRAHKIFLDFSGLQNEGWLAPGLLLGVPAFGVGMLICISFQASLFIAGLFFAVTSTGAGLFYRAFPYKRILEELSQLHERDYINKESIHAVSQRRNELIASVVKTKQAEKQRALDQQHIRHCNEMEEAARIERLRALLGYQRADPWEALPLSFLA